MRSSSGVRTPRWARLLVAFVNAIAAIGVAAYGTASPLARRADADTQLATVWGAALAAIVALVSVAAEAAALGWIAIGYLLWASLLTAAPGGIVYLALAISLAPVVPRPRGSLARGLIVAMATATAISILRRFV